MTKPRHLLRGQLAALLVASTPACSLLSPGGCDTYAGFVLSILVTDSGTNQPIGIGRTITLISAGSGDSVVLTLPPGAPQPLRIPETSAPSGGSVYTIDVQVQGYRRWRREQISVARDGCGHPKTRSITAALAPL